MAGEGEAAMSVPAEGEEQGTLAPPPWEQALAVCLGRGSADMRTVCMLLVTAKRLRALLHEHCRPGSLAVCFRMRTSLARGRGFAAWLSHHSSLLSDLDLDLEIISKEQKVPGEQQQQHPADAVLAQLPASLTRLVMHNFGSGTDVRTIKTARAASLAKALAVQPMQQLRELQLLDHFVHAADDQVVRSAIAGSSQLTSIVVLLASRTAAAAVVRCLDAPLPAQLQQLVVELDVGLDPMAAQLQQLVVELGVGANPCPPLAVAHLTRLTRLVMPAPLDSGSGGVPSSVVSLGVEASADAAPQLLALTQLTQLQLQSAARMPAEQLRSLSGLRQLQHLELHESDSTSSALYVAESASSFSVLPLKRLDARLSASRQLTAACLADIGSCTGLTRLLLEWYTLAPGACVEQLAAAVAQLTALRCLSLVPPNYGGGMGVINTGAAEALARAVGGLQHLTECDVSGHRLGPMVVHLGSALALTSLTLTRCGLRDADVAAVCAALPGLRRLELFMNARLTDACLAAIASTQRQLTLLYVPRRSPGRISPSGMARLAVALPGLDIEDDAINGFDSEYGSGYDSEYDADEALAGYESE